MKAIKTFSILLIIIISFTSFAQNFSHSEEGPYIEVIGKAEKEIVPNEIFITINIHERINGRDKVTIAIQEADLKKALKDINIPLENLSLSHANSNYVNLKWSKKDVITKTTYELKVTDAMEVGEVFEKLDDLKITDAFIARVDHSEKETIQKDVRIMAIKAAKEKADYLLTAIGEKTGKPQIIKEEYNRPYHSNVRGARTNTTANYVDGNDVKGEDNFMQFEKIMITSSIYVKFKIE